VSPIFLDHSIKLQGRGHPVELSLSHIAYVCKAYGTNRAVF